MSRFKSLLLRLSQHKGMKYVVVMVLAVVLVGLVGENSVWSHFRNKRKIYELNSEIERYRYRYEHDMMQLRILDRNPKAIEKIARERYFMKADDEDIFVLSDDERDPQQKHTDETTE